MTRCNFCNQNNKDDSFVFKVFPASGTRVVWISSSDKNISMANVQREKCFKGHHHLIRFDARTREYVCPFLKGY